MSTVRQELDQLRAEVADLTEQVAELREHAFMLKTLDELVIEHHGYAPAAIRPRNLRLVDDGAS